ncbi:Myc-type, basic helix-loop-helix domain-containing protein [Tanacetum coccineum]
MSNKAKPEGSIAEGYVSEEALTFCSRYLKDDVETRFNRLGRNDDGLPEEEPDKFQVFRSVCKPTGRIKETRLTTDVMQAVVWFVLNNSPEVDTDILAYREDSPDNVETSFPAWFNYKYSFTEENRKCFCKFSLACGPTSACTYPACIVNGVKFVVHERDILHTTQCSGVSTPGLDGEMYYGQLEEILELTYIGHRKVVLFRCKWFDTINPKNHTTRNRRSYIDQGIHHILTDREFHKNNQYILATQATQVFYLQDLARQPRDLSINAQSTEVYAPPVNDDNANANEDNADFINNEDDVVAHVLDDDDVVVSDDDEVNPSTNVEEVLSSDDSDDDN